MASPTAMAIVIQAFQAGDLQRVGHEGVVSLCIGDAFDDATLDQWRSRMGRKTVVSFDTDSWTKDRDGTTEAA